MHRTFGARHSADGGGMHRGGHHGMAIHHGGGHHGFGRGGPAGFGRGFGMGGPGFGFWGPGPFLRGCAPPRYGYHGYYYNYPGLVIGTAIVGTALIVGSQQSRHNIYVRQRQQLAPGVVLNTTSVKKYYIDIPQDVYPGETFRVVLDGEEMIITCPDISAPGERVVISVEQPPQPVIINDTPHVVRSQQVMPTHGQVVRGEIYPTGSVIRCEPVQTTQQNTSYASAPQQQQSQPNQGNSACIPGTFVPAQFVVGHGEVVSSSGVRNDGTLHLSTPSSTSSSSHEVVYDSNGFASHVVPRGRDVSDCYPVAQAVHSPTPPQPPLNTSSSSAFAPPSTSTSSGAGGVATYPLGTPASVWVKASPTVNGHKQMLSSQPVAANKDHTNNVISCPQCTFYNPSVAKHCEICNSAL